MKKIVTILLTLSFLVVVPVVFAETITVIAPPGAINAKAGDVVNNILKIVFSLAAFMVLVFLIIGAFQWIMSGGDKDAVGKARNRITHALIGLAILVLAFVIAQIIGTVIGINILTIDLPNLSTPVVVPTPTP